MKERETNEAGKNWRYYEGIQSEETAHNLGRKRECEMTKERKARGRRTGSSDGNPRTNPHATSRHSVMQLYKLNELYS